MRISLAQTCPLLGDVAANHAEILRTIERERSSSDFIVFPELTLTGYGLGAGFSQVAMHRDDPRLRELAAVAGDVTVQVGFVEETERFEFFNSVALLRAGEVLHVHRKVNLPNYGMFEEAKLFQKGRDVRTVRLHGFEVAPLICADAWNPAIVHLAALGGASLLSISVNSPHAGLGKKVSSAEGWRRLCRVYATLYGCYVLFVNRGGQEGATSFWGGSELVDPLGNSVTQTSSTESVVLRARLDSALCREARLILPTLRDDDPHFLQTNLDRILRSTKP